MVFLLSSVALSGFSLIIPVIFGSCCGNVVFLESFLKTNKNCGSLLTFLQFVLLALLTFPFQARFEKTNNKYIFFKLKLIKGHVPLKKWFIMVIMYYASSMFNNIAYNCSISVPLHIVFRSSSLIASMLLGKLIMKKKYTVRQQIAVVIVTIGVVWATLVAQKAMKHDSKNLRDSTIVADGLDESTNKWAFGLLVLSMSVLTASFLGIYQEGLYKRYGGDWKESMFYLHFLALPLFYFSWSDIRQESTIIGLNSTNTSYSFNGQAIPADGTCSPSGFLSLPIVSSNWFYLISILVSQIICTVSVNLLAIKTTSLTLNLVLTMRKMLSLVISFVIFKSNNSIGFVLGSLLTIFGTFLYAYDHAGTLKLISYFNKRTERKEKRE